MPLNTQSLSEFFTHVYVGVYAHFCMSHTAMFIFILTAEKHCTYTHLYVFMCVWAEKRPNRGRENALGMFSVQYFLPGNTAENAPLNSPMCMNTLDNRVQRAEKRADINIFLPEYKGS